MPDTFAIAKQLASYVNSVLAEVAIRSGLEEDAAIIAAKDRVFDHLQLILQNAIEGNLPEDLGEVLAQALRRPPT